MAFARVRIPIFMVVCKMMAFGEIKMGIHYPIRRGFILVRWVLLKGFKGVLRGLGGLVDFEEG